MNDPAGAPDPAYRPNVGIMLLNPAGEAWIGRRIGMSGQNWQMPQGGIDPGEAPRDAALRELAEEIGTAKAEILIESAGWLTYELPPNLAPARWKGRWRGQAQRWYAMRFTGSDADIAIATAHPEFSEWRWVPRAQLATLIIPFKRAVYEAVLAEFEPKLNELGL
jgi:putative (di)nucleoside polyphosphate hydrolase